MYYDRLLLNSGGYCNVPRAPGFAVPILSFFISGRTKFGSRAAQPLLLLILRLGRLLLFVTEVRYVDPIAIEDPLIESHTEAWRVRKFDPAV
jgi:hypothetical protein